MDFCSYKDKLPNQKRLKENPPDTSCSACATIENKRMRREARKERKRHMRDAMREGFAGVMIIEDRDSAFAHASQEDDPHEEKSYLAFWVDKSVPLGSRNGSPGAAGVVYKSDCRTFNHM